MSDAPVLASPGGAGDQAILTFIRKALAAQESLNNSGNKILWYRGQGNKDWPLQPGLFRLDTAGPLEAHAYDEWVRRADVIEKPEQKEWHHLFNMQHYGVPTRLLDWTESFAIAIGFTLAFSNEGRKSTPRIYVLDPVALNKKTTGQAKIFEIPNDETLSYRKTYLQSQGIMPTGPVAVKPSSYTLNNRRADNQAGVFTIHDNSKVPLDTFPPDIVTSFTIEPEDVPGAKMFLKLSNVNPYTIYPDFGGLAGYIRSILTGEMK
jgi:hypothetical protein